VQSIVARNEENTAIAVAAEAVQAILDTMAANRAHPGVQWAGCDAIASLLRFGQQATNSAVLEAIIAALRAQPGDQMVQRAGCESLKDVLFGSAGAAARFELRSKAVELGAVAAVVAALQARPTNAVLLHRASYALATLTCKHEPGCVQAERAGAIGAVTAAMRAHLCASGVQISGCVALCSVIGDSASRRAAAGAAGVVDAVLSALRTHPDDAEVRSEGCQALLDTIRKHEGNRQQAVAAGAIEAVVAVAAACQSAQQPFSSYDAALDSLTWLNQTCEAYHDRAMRAGALDVFGALPEDEMDLGQVQLIAHLRAAAKRHDDAATCAHAMGCKRCAVLRERCERCALPGCGARKRESNVKKTLHVPRCRLLRAGAPARGLGAPQADVPPEARGRRSSLLCLTE
jgi:hypothetical protein